MKIRVASPLAKNRAANSFKIADLSISVDDSSRSLVLKNGDATTFIEGEIYYYTDGSKTKIFNRKDKSGFEKELAKAMLGVEPGEIPHRFEGNYCGITIDEKKQQAVIFCDYLNRKNFFYTKSGSELLASTNLKEVIAELPEITYSQEALYSYCLLGYAPGRETFYKNVFRLGHDEAIYVSKEGIHSKTESKPAKIEQYEKRHIDVYDELISTAVSSRASSSENVVMNSGGWDSTSLIYLLSKDHDVSKVRSIVMEVLLTDKQSFNCYEVDKVERISKFYGIKTEKCEIDYSDKSIIDVWESNLKNLRENHVYFWLHHLKLASQIGDQATQDCSIFNGEASDSIHNFGYSQFVSVNYPEMFLREYADKGKSYLYGPTFFKKIADGSFVDDEVYRFFKYYYGADKFETPSEGKFEKYLQSFMLSYPRVPFAKWQNSSVATPLLAKEYATHLNATYFAPVAGELSSENLYYQLLQMYRIFHFQSAQIQINQAALVPFNMICKMPFLDLNMVKYMYSMPENWGRGLELRTTKYPLRYLANERWNMPLDILEEGGPHSYIAENDKKWTYAGGSWSIYCEILYKSVFTAYFKDVFRSTSIERYFSPTHFDLKHMRSIIDNFVEGKEDIANVGLLFKLGMLLSIGVYDQVSISAAQVANHCPNTR